MLYAADFENTIDNMYSTYVWSAGICNVKTKEYEVFENIDDFIDYIKLNVEEKSTIYFHNLNYDINFLLAYLNKNYYEEVPANKRGWIDFNCGYNIIATIEGVFYQLTVQFDTGKQVRFRDSLKLVNSSLEKMGKDLGIPEEVQKLTGTIDYGKHREEGYHMTDIERQYQINDVLALAYCIEKMEEMGLTDCMTAAAFAMRQYKKILYLQDHKGASEKQKGFARSVREYFERVFPVLDDEVDKFIRSSYRGGFCYCNADSEKIYKQDLYVYDVNSMYPAQMFGVTDGTNTYGGKFPVGEAHWFNSLDELPDGIMYFVRLNAWFKVKDGYIPFIQLKNNRMFQENEYVKDSEGYQEITLTKQDYELFLKHYNIIDMEIIGGYWFYTRDNLFTEKEDVYKGYEFTKIEIIFMNYYSKINRIIEDIISGAFKEDEKGNGFYNSNDAHIKSDDIKWIHKTIDEFNITLANIKEVELKKALEDTFDAENISALKEICISDGNMMKLANLSLDDMEKRRKFSIKAEKEITELYDKLSIFNEELYGVVEQMIDIKTRQ